MATLLTGVQFVLLFAAVFAGTASADDRLQRELLARIEALELQGREQAELLQTQAAKVARQENTIRNYKQRVDDLERSMEQLMTKEHKHKGMEESEKSPAITSFNDIKPAQQPQTELIKRKGRIIDNQGDGHVAFHALLKKEVVVSHIGIDQKILFPDVMVNLGGGYHDQLGTFIAPQSGLYIFSVSITSAGNDHTSIVVSLIKNGLELGEALAEGESSNQDQGSITLVTQLVAGDEVWVALNGPADASMWGGLLDSFMGCLLIPL